jgi:S-methylmethionine-dependent homocysteine/selenocysteine methylase
MNHAFDFDRPLLLDGGTGRELLKRRVPILTHLWASGALKSAPDVVRQVHRDFIDAGADIVTTNTYGLVRAHMDSIGIGNEFAALNRTAARIAAEARDQSGRSVAIAGSLPPQARSYRPDLVGETEYLTERYREQVAILAPLVDLFICETMSTGQEALAAATAAVETGKPVFVSWTLADDRSGRLRNGETITQAAQQLHHLPVHGFLCNCCAPESLTAAAPELAATGRRHWGGYANTFLPVDAHQPTYAQRNLDPSDWDRYEAAALPFRDDLPPDAFASHAQNWRNAGATVLGGCCGASPAHIARLRHVLDGTTPND